MLQSSTKVPQVLKSGRGYVRVLQAWGGFFPDRRSHSQTHA